MQTIKHRLGTRLFFICMFCALPLRVYCADNDLLELNQQIEFVRDACGGISDMLGGLKKMAGINTAVTATATVAGGVALGTGIAKANIDKELADLEDELLEEIRKLDSLGSRQTNLTHITDEDIAKIPLVTNVAHKDSGTAGKTIDERQQEIDRLNKKSKTLGNIRTGTLATAAVADTAGTIIAAKNQVDEDLDAKIQECILATKKLMVARIQADGNGASQDPQVLRAKNISDECGAWEYVDLSKINKRAKGAAISSGVGAAMAIAGTVTSAVANTSKVRDDNSEAGRTKEKNLNTASNVLAGGTTLASGAATIFNATQISAIKRAIQTAENCEGALK